MDDAAAARQKKIEAGKMMLAKFKRQKGAQQKPAISGESTPSSKSEISLPESFSQESPVGEKETNREIEEVTEVPPASSASNAASDSHVVEDCWAIEHCAEQDESWLPTDDLNIIKSYGRRLEQLQEGVQQRDFLISQLSFRLETSIEAQNIIQKERDSQVEALVQELNSYKLQVQQAKEMASKQKTKNGIPAQEFLDIQKKNVILEEKISQMVIHGEQLQQKLIEKENQLREFSKIGISAQELFDIQSKNSSLEEKISELTVSKENLRRKLSEAENKQKELYELMHQSLPSKKEEVIQKVLETSDKCIQVQIVNEKKEEFCDIKKQSFIAEVPIEIGIQVTSSELFENSDFVGHYVGRADLSAVEKSLLEQYQSVVMERDGLKQMLLDGKNKSSIVGGRSVSPETNFLEMNCEQQAAINMWERSMQKTLKRIVCINDIVKTVNCLVNSLNFVHNQTVEATSSQPKHSANDLSILEPQNEDFLLRGTEELLSSNKASSILHSGSSTEVFRNSELSENVSTLIEFLQEEMDLSYSQFNSSLNESNLLGVKKFDSLSAESSGDIEKYAIADEGDKSIFLHNLKLSCDLASRERERFDSSMQCLTKWVKGEKQHPCLPMKRLENGSLPEFDNIFLEEMPLSSVSLASFGDMDGDSLTVACEGSENKFYESGSVCPDRERISGGHLYTIHEESVEDQIQNPEKDVEEVDAESVAGRNTIEKSTETDYYACEIVEKCTQTENTNHLEALQSLKLILELELLKIQENFECGYECQKQRVNEKIEKFKNVETRFILYKQTLENKHEKEIENLRKVHQSDSNRRLTIISDLEEKLKTANSKIIECEDEKLKIECYWQNQIADLVAEHNQDSETLKQSYMTLLQNKQEEKNHEIEEIKKAYQTEIRTIEMCVLDKTQKFDENISSLKEMHALEVSAYQKKVESLLEEKCELLQKSKEESQCILSQIQASLKDLHDHVRSKIVKEKEKLEASVSIDESLESSFVEILDELNQNIQVIIDNFYREKPLIANNRSPTVDEKGDLTNETLIHDIFPLKSVGEVQQTVTKQDKETMVEISFSNMETKELDPLHTCSENPVDSEQVHGNIVMEEINRMKQEFEDELGIYKTENEKLDQQVQLVTNKLTLLEEYNMKLKAELQKAENVCKVGSGEVADSSVRESLTGPSLASTEMHSWRVQAAQTNSRLLHVLSDLVKTFLDIENEINTRLMEFGLMGLHAEALLHHHDDDTVQSVGSREDFTGLGVGESPNLELHEDGPDLTPRAWDLFTSMSAYDVDTEGEDVVLGASRRLRSAVDHVLYLLSLALDKPKEQDFKLLLKRNEDLSHELQEECQDRDNLQLDLVNAESIIRKCEAEKHKLEDENFHLSEGKELLSREVDSLKIKIAQLDDEKERLYEQKKMLQEQLDVLSSRLGDPEKKLLQENSKLSSEKLSLQKNSNKERQHLIARIQQLELSQEEITAQKEDIIEKMRQEMEDRKSQIDSMEKQLQSYKKFINEQANEREQEREEALKEIKKLNNVLREKEKIQLIENQHSKEAEGLEQQLKAKIEEHKAVLCKKEEVERELRQSLDKIHDLREVIAELEKQLESKLRHEIELKQKLGSALKSLSVHEKFNEDLKIQLEECNSTSANDESAEKLRSLEEQLASKTQELEQLSQSETLLQELRGQIHFLEAKVDQKLRHIESLQLVSLTASPVMSDDASHSESHDGELHQVHYEDGWEMSPRSIHWLEIRRLEEKICRLIHIEDEVIKQNKEMSSHLKKLHVIEDELIHEKDALQEQSMDQLIQISALKSHIDELRQRVHPSLNGQAVAELERLKEALNTEQEKRQRTLLEVKDLKVQNSEMEVELQEKSKIIQNMRNKPQYCSVTIQTEDADSSDSQVSTINDCHLPPWLKSLLKEKNSQIKHLTEELQKLEKNEKEIIPLEEEVAQLHKKLLQTESDLAASKEEITCLLAQIVKLENLSKKSKEELEHEQKQLEKDFDTVQDMMQKKEKELCALQDETENQLHLEAAAELLQQQLAEQRLIDEQLCGKIKILEKELTEAKLLHEQDIEKWQKKIDDLTKKYASEHYALKNQICLLKENFSINKDCEDIDLKEGQVKIAEAVAKLKDISDESKDLFKHIIFKILEQVVNLKVSALKKHQEEEVEYVHKSWSQKLEEETAQMQQSAKEQLKREIAHIKRKFREEQQSATNTLKEKYNEELKKLLDDRDMFWQEKMQSMESSLNADRESIKNLLLADGQSKNEVAKKVEEVKRILEDVHQKEVLKLKDIIEKQIKEKEANEELLKSLHEKEKSILIMEFEKKFFFVTQQLKSKFDQGKQNLQENYQRQMQELQQGLNSKLEDERNKLELKRQDELKSLQAALDKQWKEEMMKFHQLHQAEIQELKESKGNMEDVLSRLFAIFEERLKSIQNDYAAQVTEERTLNFSHQQEELQKLQKELQEKFEQEKQELFNMKEKQMRTELQQQKDKEFLEKVESRELENFTHNIKILEDNWQKRLEAGEKALKAAHQKEISLMKQNFEMQLKSQEDKLLKQREENLRELRRHCNRKLTEANEVIKALKAASAKSRANNKVSSSEVNSSDDACSSSVGDLLPRNQDRLVKKIHRHGAWVLAASENLKPQRNECGVEAQSLIDERTWIITQLKLVLSTDDLEECELKLLVNKVVEEIVLLRKSVDSLTICNTQLREEICRLQQRLGIHSAEVCKLDQHIKMNSHCGVITTSNGNTIPFEPGRSVNNISENTAMQLSSTIEQPRSEFIPRSTHFGAPSIGNSDDSPYFFARNNKSNEKLANSEIDHVKWADNLQIHCVEKEQMQSFGASFDSAQVDEIKFTSTPRQQDKSNSSLDEEDEEWRTTLVKVVTPKSSALSSSAAKVHYLYWKYRKNLSYRRALIYQKNYLLKLIGGFQATEEITAAMLAKIGVDISKSLNHSNASSIFSINQHPRVNLFRSTALAIIAVARMKHLVALWRKACAVPSSKIIDNEIWSLLNKASLKSSFANIGAVIHSSNSSISTPSCEDGLLSRSANRSNRGNSANNINSTETGHLMEYVNRLETLHKQLGLDDHSKS